jgi:alginate O-acetyltransferase complex protein AlgJ
MAIDPEAREREALAEMAATSVARPTALALVGAGLVLLALGAGPELAAVARGESRLVEPLPAPSVEPGPFPRARRAALAAREIERRFDEESVAARAVRPHGQRLLTAAARYGNEEAYVGRDGWLHFRADFDHLTRRPRAAAAGEAAAAIVSLRDQLAARGIALLVVPTPVKLAVEPETFVRGAPAAPLRPAVERELLEALARAGVAVADLSPRLARRSRESTAAYLERDTHWRPESMDEAARDVAIELRALAALPAGDPERWLDEESGVEGVGDLDGLLGAAGRPPRQRVAARPVRSAAGAPWRPERGAPVLVLGDSFAAIYSQPDLGWGAGAGFAERLAFHLGLPVDRIARNAGGASATREALAAELARDPARLDGVAAIVWQLAARELSGGDWREVELPSGRVR